MASSPNDANARFMMYGERLCDTGSPIRPKSRLFPVDAIESARQRPQVAEEMRIRNRDDAGVLDVGGTFRDQAGDRHCHRDAVIAERRDPRAAQWRRSLDRESVL